MNNKKTIFIGPKEYFKAFRLLGFECISADSEQEAIKKINKRKKEEETGLIFASRDVLNKQIEGVTLIPGLVEKSKSDYLENKIKKAIGNENITLSG